MSVAMRDAFGNKLAELGKTNDKLVVLDADVSSSTKSAIFGKAFPGRFFNAGVAEGNMVGVAAGLATAGYHPVVNAFSIFLALKSTTRSGTCSAQQLRSSSGCYGRLSDSRPCEPQSITDSRSMRAMPHMESSFRRFEQAEQA